ncbi:MAG TPA: cation diffusion facilitator family transporter [Anaerolineales bacterium]|nr:cation diffusion facilitator family transporter [Anaerolineales bacterium]
MPRWQLPADKEIRSLYMTVGLYFVIVVIKLVAYFSTHVLALLAESFHTLSDLFISGFLLVALLWSRRGADQDHMFGHGRAQNVAALLAATLFLSFTSYKLYEEAIPKLFHPASTTHENLPIAIGVLVASMLIAGAPLISLIRQKALGAAAKAQMIELINDELGVLSALIGTLFIAAGHPLADPIATIIVATIIAINAIGVFRENLGLVLGKSPGKDYIEKVRQIASSTEGVLGVVGPWAEYIGPDSIHVDVQIKVASGISIDAANTIARKVRQRIQDEINCLYCSVHPEP